MASLARTPMAAVTVGRIVEAGTAPLGGRLLGAVRPGLPEERFDDARTNFRHLLEALAAEYETLRCQCVVLRAENAFLKVGSEPTRSAPRPAPATPRAHSDDGACDSDDEAGVGEIGGTCGDLGALVVSRPGMLRSATLRPSIDKGSDPGGRGVTSPSRGAGDEHLGAPAVADSGRQGSPRNEPTASLWSRHCGEGLAAGLGGRSRDDHQSRSSTIGGSSFGHTSSTTDGVIASPGGSSVGASSADALDIADSVDHGAARVRCAGAGKVGGASPAGAGEPATTCGASPAWRARSAEAWSVRGRRRRQLTGAEDIRSLGFQRGFVPCVVAFAALSNGFCDRDEPDVALGGWCDNELDQLQGASQMVFGMGDPCMPPRVRRL